MEEASRFSSQIIVPVCDHFFDGTPENRSLLEEIYKAFPEVQFVEYPFIPRKISKKLLKSLSAHFWHSLSRLIAFQFLDEGMEYVLFLDADEIPDGCRFFEWFACGDVVNYAVLKMANYWYFREVIYQADVWEDSILLAHKRAITPSMLLHRDERDAIYHSISGQKQRKMVGVDGNPMFHHYSWVRTREEMLRKVKSWGHKSDRNWEVLVKKEFDQPFQGVDFVHQYRFKTVSPFFEVHSHFESRGNGKVIRLTSEGVLAITKTG